MDEQAVLEDEGVEGIHNFIDKLRQPSVFESLKQYVLWQHAIRNSPNPEELYSSGPDFSPISINLDITTACNYACDHCVDLHILNTGKRYDYDKLKSSLELMIDKGLKSAILIGGGEPTLDPKFEEIFTYLKEKEIQVAIVTNGSGMRKIGNLGNLFDQKDWVRLSLDSGTDSTFQAMHKPKKAISLDQICDDVLDVKRNHPNVNIGFSYIITWKGAYTNDTNIVPNIHEIVQAAGLAKEHLFDYITYKPFITRSPETGSETIQINDSHGGYNAIMKNIKMSIEEAGKLEDENFKIIESSNMHSLERREDHDYTKQPKNCHATFFRQVLSPLGLFNCPIYRNVPEAKIADKDAYSSLEAYNSTRAKTMMQILNFDAAQRCSTVTCAYNPLNWFIEDLVQHPEKLATLSPTEEHHDYYF
ncbi:MAG: radical SAM protein [Nanoarchaeota archaeon]|nr:radical SAM protein [Nanoarchaeota archaeon]